jgi:HEAT repeat protein
MADDRQPGLSPDDVLPPVEPPSASFILQLFIVPGVIVVVVVMIWLMFNWLAQKGNDRDAFVRALARNNDARWQAAFNLANALRAERGAKNGPLTGDGELARQLAEILDREIAAGSMEDNPVTLRIYLCRALGEFRVPGGLPVLIKAAQTERDPKESDVRRAALEGIALLAANIEASGKELDPPTWRENSSLDETLHKASQDPDPRTRAVSAVALGVIGGPKNLARLREMLDDLDADVRYNAAVRMAQHGDEAAVPVLVEMLDQYETAGVESEKSAEMRPFKRALITINALRAAAQMAEKNPRANIEPLVAAVDKLDSADLEGELRLEVTNTSRQLHERAPARR